MGKLNCGNWMIRACGVLLLWAGAAIALPAQTFTTVHNFDGTDGSQSDAALVQGVDGKLYGATQQGGDNRLCLAYTGCGTVFNITPSGLTTLHSFDGTDGLNPDGLVHATDGKFYGTTYEGGTNDSGTVFQLAAGGMLTTLYSFCSQGGINCSDGAEPFAGLVRATNGNFYGTTAYGGANSDGTVFKITPGGALTTLYSFCSQSDCVDGKYSYAGLVQGADGDFYGTTFYGGIIATCQSKLGCGTVFKITPSGTLTTLHRFDGTDGAGPVGALVRATDGEFYGTTSLGGAFCPSLGGCGTVFKITPSGTLTTLHSFDGTDGNSPAGRLVQATDGDFYGTTAEGGASLNGSIFRITPSGALTTLHSFDIADGQDPSVGLIQGTDGTFYGTTYSGGAFCPTQGGCGTVFSLSVGLGPFVETNPSSGTVGSAVNILGTDLIGTTSVTFNSTTAAFTVKSKTEITAIVPAGAATGTVKVVTPGGTLSSNVPFRVRP